MFLINPCGNPKLPIRPSLIFRLHYLIKNMLLIHTLYKALSLDICVMYGTCQESVPYLLLHCLIVDFLGFVWIRSEIMRKKNKDKNKREMLNKIYIFWMDRIRRKEMEKLLRR